MIESCYMLPPEKPPCFIILGRFGDIIQLLPAFQAVYERTHFKPVIMCSTEYAGVLDGVTYVEPYPVHWPWWQGVPEARKLASELFGGGIVCQWWADEPFMWNPAAFRQLLTESCIVLQSHGHGWGVDMGVVPNYGTSMWTRAGFSAEEMRSLPLVFDKRDSHREWLLVSRAQWRNPKPILLVNFTGHSSPFGPHPEVMREVNAFSGRFNVVDLGKIKATRIYDLLGLYDVAAGLITTDTATMHLAAAGNVEYIGYTVDGWCSSVPKGRCLAEIKYSAALDRMGELKPILEKWSQGRVPGDVPKPAFAGAGGGGGMMRV